MYVIAVYHDINICYPWTILLIIIILKLLFKVLLNVSQIKHFWVLSSELVVSLTIIQITGAIFKLYTCKWMSYGKECEMLHHTPSYLYLIIFNETLSVMEYFIIFF